MVRLTPEAAILFASILCDIAPRAFGDLRLDKAYWEEWCKKSGPPVPWEGILDMLFDYCERQVAVRAVFEQFCSGPVDGVRCLELAAEHQLLLERSHS
jgi:hypothetical protein